MNKLIGAALEVQRVLDSAGVRFCFIGGFAAQRHAEPRVTRDVDVSILTGLGNEAAVIDLMLGAFLPRREDAREFALSYRVLLLKTAGEIGIDATLTGLDYEAEVIERSSLFEFAAGIYLRTCSAEDLLVMKAFAGRPIDWRDVEMVLRRYRGGALDLDYVDARLRILIEAKQEPELWTEWLRLRQRHSI
jgi:predicted nucleotidyltransferase